MSLIGTPVLVLAVLLAVATPVLTVVFWQRMRLVLLRLVAVLACQLTVLLAAGFALNDYGYFYGSWGELFGQGATLGSTAASFATTLPVGHRVHSRLQLNTAGGSGNAGNAGSALARQSGRILHVHITGAASGLDEQAVVYLPPEYFQTKDKHKSFPAVLELTGYPAASNVLGRLTHYAGILRHDIRTGRSKPMILVAMTPSPLFPRDTECTDVPGGPQVLTFLSQDVPDAVQTHFRVQDDNWGTLGDSTGGYCATKIAMTSPAKFTAAVSMSGYYNALQDSTTGDLYAGSPVVRDLNDLDWRLQHLPPPPISVLATVGSGEVGPEGIANAHRFLSLVRAPMRAYQWVIPGGAHNFGTWHRELPTCFHFLSRELHPSRVQETGTPAATAASPR